MVTGLSGLPVSDDFHTARIDRLIIGVGNIDSVAAIESTGILGLHKGLRVLFGKAILETKEGVTISLDMFVVIAINLA